MGRWRKKGELMNDARLKIIRNLIKNSQTVPMMATAPKPKVNSVTPAVPATPATPATPPASNVIEPPKTQTEPTEVPTNAVPTTPIVNNEQPQTVPQENVEEEELKQSFEVYNVVKKAIDDKKDKLITAKYYYENIYNEDAEYLMNKTFAARGVDGIMKIATITDKSSIVDENIISLYEPVSATTTNFRIDVFGSKLQSIVKVCAKLEKFKIDSNIFKFADRYEIRCSSNSEIDTNTMLSYLESVTADMNVSLDDLKVGKLKRVSFSLDANGEDGTFIRIG